MLILTTEKEGFLWSILEEILCFLWKIYLRDTAYFYHFLIGAQSKEVPIQKEFRIYSKQGFFVIPNVS